MADEFNTANDVVQGCAHTMIAAGMPTLRSPSAASSGPSITYAPVIDATGADADAVARLEQVMDRQQREFSANVLKSMKTHKQTRAWS
ncbi:hypothetical protein J2X72_003909 [Phyllobacterium sp. 1468]|nr:hypothetical protein [Phyllobacterium sp. 1468]